jgi:hypothetical protein
MAANYGCSMIGGRALGVVAGAPYRGAAQKSVDVMPQLRAIPCPRIPSRPSGVFNRKKRMYQEDLAAPHESAAAPQGSIERNARNRESGMQVVAAPSYPHLFPDRCR